MKIYNKISFFFQKKKLNREEFDAFRKQQNDLFDRIAALERSIDALRSSRTTVSKIIT